MASFVVFNGITKYRPGVISRVQASALDQVIPSENSIVAILGEADGGAPGAVSGLVSHLDPSRAVDEFREGVLVDGARIAFQASNDPEVPGGASQVLLWKTNQSTRLLCLSRLRKLPS